MSRNSRVMDCTPDDVFAVLTNGWTYANWVVGSVRIRDVDPDWPAIGSKIHHSVGAWPMLIDDDSEVEHIAVPQELRLKVRAWPTGEGRVIIRCQPQDGSTLVTIDEDAVAGPARLVPPIMRHQMLAARNEEALRRLAYLAEGNARRPSPDPAHPPPGSEG